MFKNLTVFRIGPDWAADLLQAEAALDKDRFVECGATQQQSAGWVAPRGPAEAPLLESIAGQWLLRLMVEQRVVPGAVVKRRTDEIADQLEQSTGRRPGRRQTKELKEQALLELLPQAFTKRASIGVWLSPTDRWLIVDTGSATLAQELARTFAASPADATTFVLPSEALLAHWLRRTAALSQALPNQAVATFEQRVQAELSQLAPPVAQSTEVLRMVRQRLGQQAYRQAMLDYWGGACAVTGLALAPVLRASHAKPWAVCESDAERLDVFNGLLLAAHLDALFDQFLLSFDEHGRALISPQLDAAACELLGLRPTMQMRWMAPEHQRYMGYHRQRFLTGP